ncbi:LysR family transcriptional regulator [Paludibacterium sp. THUN1379]|uniref:LysR family transcriptional regulator n=1 Tax=Paludibacterium sp. THUN1379 TaxID=3112107 RepID=UPI00308C569A|nr:LysR family transcriptional regulator [Paludibacterium sp. THUN1379]
MTFLAVAQYGGFSAAAARLGQSKAYVSKQVSLLEQALGVLLLHRTTRRVTLTQAGQRYLSYCQQLRDTFDEAQRAVGDLQSDLSGLVRLSVPTSLGVVFVAELMRQFSQQYPRLEIELDLSQQARDLLGDGFDLAIRVGPVVDERLVAHSLGLLEEWVVIAPSRLAQCGLPQTPNDLLDAPCVLNSHYRAAGEWLFSHRSQSYRIQMHSRYSVNSYMALRQLALSGAGYVKLPDYLVREEVTAGALVRVLADYALPRAPIYLVHPPLRPMPARVRVLIDYLRQWFAQQTGK